MPTGGWTGRGETAEIAHLHNQTQEKDAVDEGSLSSLTILLILLVGNMLITLGHNALVNARKSELALRAEDGSRSAALALRLSQDAAPLLNGYQLSVIIVRFFAAGIAAVGLAPALARWLVGLGLVPLTALILAQVLVLLFGSGVMLTVGGQIPAAIGAANADRLAPLVARPMRVMIRVLAPLSLLLRAFSDGVIRLLGIEYQIQYVTEEEIKTLVDAGQEEGVIETEEKEMIYSIFQLTDTSVREVMVPRLDMVAIRLDTPLDDAVQIVLDAGHSRIPVYEYNIDHIRGLLYAKDLLKLWGSGANGDALANLLRDTYFVPEGKNAMDLLREMQAKRVHMAIVVDEYGGTAGLVTLEDLIEEIIGEVLDEYDVHEKAAYTQVNEDEYICNARLDLDDLNYLLDINLPTDESDTLGGYIFSQVGEVPVPGMIIDTEQVRLEVLTVDKRRIGQVRVTRLQEAVTADDSAGAEG
jgi:putative hemolysin